ncbi:MATE family efflux transporter [Flagellimonas sp. 2504JD4-2]
MLIRIKKLLGDTDIKELLFKGGSFFLIKAVGLLCSFAFMWFLAHKYGAKVNGLMAISISIIMIGSIVPKLGYDINFVRLFPIKQANKILFREAIGASTLTALILMALIVLFEGHVADWFGVSTENIGYIRFSAVAIPIWVFISVASSVYRADKKNAQFSFYTNTSRFLFSLVIILVLYYVFGFRSEDAPVKAYLIALLVSAVLLTIGIWPILNNRFSAGARLKLIDFTKDSLPMMLSASIVVMMGWADTIILSLFESKDVVGVYSIAVRLATLVSFGLNSLNSILAPKLSSFYNAGEIPKYKNLIGITAKVNFFFSLMTIALIIVFRNYILSFFGEEFLIGAAALVLLCVGQLVNAICGPVGVILQMTGHQKTFKNFLVLALIVNVALNLVLIPIWGMLGGALATIMAMAVWNISSAVYIKTKLNIKSYYLFSL